MNIVKTLRKEKPRLIKLPNGTVMCVLSFLLFFLFSPKSPSYFGKLMRLNRKRSEISATYCIGIVIMYPLKLLIMKSRLRQPSRVRALHLMLHCLSHLCIRLVVSDVTCVFSAETHFLAFCAIEFQTIELRCKIILSLKIKKAWLKQSQ